MFDFILFNNPARERWEDTRRNLEKVGLKPGMRVADVGSGPGYFTFKFSDIVGETGRVYARTKNGTVDLSTDEHGFFTKTDLSKTASARGVYEDIKAGNYTQMSFAFTVAKQHFDEFFEDRGDGKNIRIVKRVIDQIKKVYDISAVGFPANPNTDIGVATRAAFDGAIESFEAERLSEKRAKQERAKKEAELKLKLLEVNLYD